MGPDPRRVDMRTAPATGICLIAFSLTCLTAGRYAGPDGSPAAQLPEKHDPEQHQHGHEMNLQSGVTGKCEPAFAYDEGPHVPSHWAGVCGNGRMQAPIDITK